MILSCEQMRRAEQDAFARGVKADALMELAGAGIAREIRRFFPKPSRALAFCGAGNNGGDARVALRILHEAGWNVAVRLVSEASGGGTFDVPSGSGPLVVLDGLLGIGARGPLREGILGAVREIRTLRGRGAFVVAMDLPTGLDPVTGVPAAESVESDLTTTVGFAKSCLLTDAAANVVGRLAVVPLPGVTAAEGDAARVSTPGWLAPLLPPRRFDTHKGTYGRIGIVAGSPGTYGAARLCSAAAVAAGGGLVTLFATPEAYDALATSVIPEVMVRRVSTLREVLDGLATPLDAAAVGPGAGFDRTSEILALVSQLSCPTVVDADALTVTARSPGVLAGARGPRLLTPHPGEFVRFFPGTIKDRRLSVEAAAARWPCAWLLKGARTVMAEAGLPVIFNTTGHPGMASGGMGDVLSGVAAALLARPGAGSVLETAALAAWLCGRAAEIAIFEHGRSAESLRASDVITYLGAAANALREEGGERNRG